MADKNRFDVGVVTFEPGRKRSDRSPGPMRKAVRENASSVRASSDARIEERRANAADANELRSAKDEGRLLVRLPIESVAIDDLPRDRMDLEAAAQSDAMMELKASIRDRGQRAQIEVYLDSNNKYQLKSGWRRLEALRQLNASEGGDQFSWVLAKVSEGSEDRLACFKDMVEENLIREDLSFAEMAMVAITIADDTAVSEADPKKVVGLVYGSVNKTKRSYIRSFVDLVETLGSSLKWPNDVSRNLGVDVARLMIAQPGTVSSLKEALSACSDESDQGKVLKRYLASGGRFDRTTAVDQTQPVTVKFNDMHARARGRECKLVWDAGFENVTEERLEQAIKAFRAALAG